MKHTYLTTLSNTNPNISVFSGTSNQQLANDICKHLLIEPGKIFHHTFPSGEKYCQFKENIRGKDVFIVQSPSSENNTNDVFMELLIMIDAAKRASAQRITAVMPMSFYTRQDRKDKSRVPISSRLCFDLLEKSGVNRILTMDLHAEQIAGFTNLPFDHLMFNPILSDYIQYESKYSKNSTFPNNICLMAPDAGALKRVEKYADTLKCEFGFISKRRINDETVKLQSIIGNVENKDVFLIDDLTESFGTLSQAAVECKDKGAISVTCAITHPCVTHTGIVRLKNAIDNGTVDHFIYGDTMDNKYLSILSDEDDIYKNTITKLTVSTLFARAVSNIHTNHSISSLF